jgi:hypothetical protein
MGRHHEERTASPHESTPVGQHAWAPTRMSSQHSLTSTRCPTLRGPSHAAPPTHVGQQTLASNGVPVGQRPWTNRRGANERGAWTNGREPTSVGHRAQPRPTPPGTLVRLLTHRSASKFTSRGSRRTSTGTSQPPLANNCWQSRRNNSEGPGLQARVHAPSPHPRSAGTAPRLRSRPPTQRKKPANLPTNRQADRRPLPRPTTAPPTDDHSPARQPQPPTADHRTPTTDHRPPTATADHRHKELATRNHGQRAGHDRPRRPSFPRATISRM